jgi:hypothetical protein
MKKDINLILSFTKVNGDCLEWTRCLNTDGYPRAVIDGNNNAKVHRIIYELLNGKLDSTSVVRHTCDNPKCINPQHLVKGSPAENVHDMDVRGRRHRVVTVDKIARTKELLATNLLTHLEISRIVNLDPRRVSDINKNIYSATGRYSRHG